MIAIGIRLAVVEPRIAAAVLFAGSFVPRSHGRGGPAGHRFRCSSCCSGTTRGTTGRRALDLFDAFGSQEKTLHANMGGHTGVPEFEGEDGNRFFARHLR